MTTTTWLVNLTNRSDPRLILFAFPHAGGGITAYQSWPEHLPDHVELMAVSLPGHGSRLNEPVISDIDTLSEAAAMEIRHSPARQLPCALFGHSFGAVVAFEVAFLGLALSDSG